MLVIDKNAPKEEIELLTTTTNKMLSALNGLKLDDIVFSLVSAVASIDETSNFKGRDGQNFIETVIIALQETNASLKAENKSKMYS